MNTKDLSRLYSIEESVAEKAMSNLNSSTAIFIAVSGKLGSGKDTIAPLVMEELNYSAKHEFFARPLKEEVNSVIDVIRKSSTEAEAVQLVAIELDAINHEPVVSALYNDVKNGAVGNAYERTASTRKALQWWGTEVRRAKDVDYWVKKAMNSALTKIAEDKSVYVTDARFPNEINSILSVGGDVIRLNLSTEEQFKRIFNRDGIEPNQEALNHISETALDDFPFPISINTDNLSIEKVVEVATTYLRK